MMHETVTNQQTFTSDRFVMRPLKASDAGLISLYASDEKLARATRSIPHPLPPGMVEAMIARSQSPERSEDVWVMDGSAAGHAEVMGITTLTKMDRAQSEVFYWVAPAFWNVGVASEAVRTLLAANPHEAKHLIT